MLEFLRELVVFCLERRRVWLIPILFALLAFGGLIVVQSTALAPVLYTLF